jgi:hypothetical protein
MNFKGFEGKMVNAQLRHLPEGIEENHENISQNSNVPAEIRTGNLLNTSQKRYYFSQLSGPHSAGTDVSVPGGKAAGS